MEENEIKAEIAVMLARLLARPDEELVCALNSGELSKALWLHIRMQGETSDFLNSGYTLESLTTMYDEVMGPISVKGLLPVESLFKKWCDESTANESLNEGKGLLMGDSAMHMLELYDRCGITVPAEFSGQPDHLALELEFLSILYEKALEELALCFIKDHLDWIPTLLNKWRELQAPIFYVRALEAIDSFISDELSRLTCGQEAHA